MPTKLPDRKPDQPMLPPVDFVSTVVWIAFLCAVIAFWVAVGIKLWEWLS